MLAWSKTNNILHF